LIVIGVHTPEFSFEHDINAVRRATKERAIDYPVAVDKDYAVWSAFATTPGRRCASSTPTATSATTTSAKDATSNEQTRGLLRVRREDEMNSLGFTHPA
jgi:hypothetical protein